MRIEASRPSLAAQRAPSGSVLPGPQFFFSWIVFAHEILAAQEYRGVSVVAMLCLSLLASGAAGCRSGCGLDAGDPGAAACAAKSTAPPPARLVLDLGGSVQMKLVLVPAGTFTMGSAPDERDREPDEGPARKVTITKAFYMGVCEVSQEQYETVMGRNPSRFKGPRRPVEGIWWSDAVEFCTRLSRRTGRTIHLPTEAQWEYACRAGTTRRFSFGDSDDDLPGYAHYSNVPLSTPASSGDRPAGTADVGLCKPNRWGLYDMHGNVFEWCRDWYRDSYSGLADADPDGAPSGAYRVLRGGSWSSPPWQCRSAYRHRFTADGRFNHLIGFRVVVEAASVAARQRAEQLESASAGRRPAS